MVRLVGWRFLLVFQEWWYVMICFGCLLVHVDIQLNGSQMHNLRVHKREGLCWFWFVMNRWSMVWRIEIIEQGCSWLRFWTTWLLLCLRTLFLHLIMLLSLNRPLLLEVLHWLDLHVITVMNSHYLVLIPFLLVWHFQARLAVLR
jgi:hypothetical protein